LEITDLNQIDLRESKLQVEVMGRGIAWLATGTPESLRQAGTFIETIERCQGLKVGCLGEISFQLGKTDKEQVATRKDSASDYDQYVANLSHEDTSRSR
jgi:glucose-1-phosphate thymidylyltransferase